jgi:predicted DCC family thiol-disulfide oxidoreductase YuxK
MKTIVFYDGVCGLCQRSIAYLAKADKKRKLLFAPLNGKTYKSVYGEIPSPLTSLKVYSNEQTFEKSSAVLYLCRLLGGWHIFFLLFYLIPRFVRDFCYDQIATHRKKIMCILIPNLKSDERFLL